LLDLFAKLEEENLLLIQECQQVIHRKNRINKKIYTYSNHINKLYKKVMEVEKKSLNKSYSYVGCRSRKKYLLSIIVPTCVTVCWENVGREAGGAGEDRLGPDQD
jgi:hypothetical protein